MGNLTRSLCALSRLCIHPSQTIETQPREDLTMIAFRCQPPPVKGALLPCPFCGGAAAVEPDPWHGESARITCANDECAVSPKTEYLLLCFGDEMREAWNRRPSRALAHQPAA